MINKIIAVIALSPLIATGQNISNNRMNQDSTSLVSNGQQSTVQNFTNTTSSTYVAQPVNGKCGSDNGGMNFVAPTALCTSGIPSAVTLTGNTYSWSCNGYSGGSTASCSATKVQYGSCGYSGPVGNWPSVGEVVSQQKLCSAGMPSSFTPVGAPIMAYNWSCKGNTGPAVSCGMHLEWGMWVFGPGTAPSTPFTLSHIW